MQPSRTAGGNRMVGRAGSPSPGPSPQRGRTGSQTSIIVGAKKKGQQKASRRFPQYTGPMPDDIDFAAAAGEDPDALLDFARRRRSSSPSRAPRPPPPAPPPLTGRPGGSGGGQARVQQQQQGKQQGKQQQQKGKSVRSDEPDGPRLVDYMQFGRLIGESPEQVEANLRAAGTGGVARDEETEAFLETWEAEEEPSYELFELLLKDDFGGTSTGRRSTSLLRAKNRVHVDADRPPSKFGQQGKGESSPSSVAEQQYKLVRAKARARVLDLITKPYGGRPSAQPPVELITKPTMQGARGNPTRPAYDYYDEYDDDGGESDADAFATFDESAEMSYEEFDKLLQESSASNRAAAGVAAPARQPRTQLPAPALASKPRLQQEDEDYEDDEDGEQVARLSRPPPSSFVGLPPAPKRPPPPPPPELAARPPLPIRTEEEQQQEEDERQLRKQPVRPQRRAQADPSPAAPPVTAVPQSQAPPPPIAAPPLAATPSQAPGPEQPRLAKPVAGSRSEVERQQQTKMKKKKERKEKAEVPKAEAPKVTVPKAKVTKVAPEQQQQSVAAAAKPAAPQPLVAAAKPGAPQPPVAAAAKPATPQPPQLRSPQVPAQAAKGGAAAVKAQQQQQATSDAAPSGSSSRVTEESQQAKKSAGPPAPPVQPLPPPQRQQQQRQQQQRGDAEEAALVSRGAGAGKRGKLASKPERTRDAVAAAAAAAAGVTQRPTPAPLEPQQRPPVDWAALRLLQAQGAVVSVKVVGVNSGGVFVTGSAPLPADVAAADSGGADSSSSSNNSSSSDVNISGDGEQRGAMVDVYGFVPSAKLAPFTVYKPLTLEQQLRERLQPAADDADGARRVRRQALSSLIGSRIEVAIIEVDEQSRRLVLSEREAVRLRAERGQRIQRVPQPALDILEEYVGESVSASVVNVAEFGAFLLFEVDTESAAGVVPVVGLVPLREMSWEMKTPDQVVQVGDTVRALILSVDQARCAVTLSLRAMVQDPLLQTLESMMAGEDDGGGGGSAGDEDDSDLRPVLCDMPEAERLAEVLMASPGVQDVRLGKRAQSRATAQDLEVYLAREKQQQQQQAGSGGPSDGAPGGQQGELQQQQQTAGGRASTDQDGAGVPKGGGVQEHQVVVRLGTDMQQLVATGDLGRPEFRRLLSHAVALLIEASDQETAAAV